MDEVVIDKYLANNAEKEIGRFFSEVRLQHEYVLVIPAFREGKDFLENLRKVFAHAQSVLIIVVVNAPDDCEDGDEINHDLVRGLRSLYPLKNQCSILIAGPLRINRHQGVGLARKFGCDMALRLIRQGWIRTPIIFSTDADAMLPTDYFCRAHDAQRQSCNSACFVYPFFHARPVDARKRRAIELYEMRLHQYVEGLMRALSPYAFHTIGSTLAIDAVSYARVRGFPKRAAGEDFYILNKLAKVGTITQLNGKEIQLSARLSARVPFGTGPALSRLVQEQDLNDAKIFYHPRVFDQLRGFIKQSIVALEQRENFLLDELNQQAFLSLKGASALNRTLNLRPRASDRVKSFHDWFDGFRTLKFIHYLRNTWFPMCSFNDLNANVRVIDPLRRPIKTI